MRVPGLILFGVTALMAFAQIMQMPDEGLSESWDLWSCCSFLLAAGFLIGFGLAYWLNRKLVTSDFEQQVHGFLTVAGHALMILGLLLPGISLLYQKFKTRIEGAG